MRKAQSRNHHLLPSDHSFDWYWSYYYLESVFQLILNPQPAPAAERRNLICPFLRLVGNIRAVWPASGWISHMSCTLSWNGTSHRCLFWFEHTPFRALQWKLKYGQQRCVNVFCSLCSQVAHQNKHTLINSPDCGWKNCANTVFLCSEAQKNIHTHI